PTGSPSSGLLQMQPPLHGARLPPPLHAPPVHASHANRASAWSSPESSFKETRRSASLCESRLFRFRFKPSGLCSSKPVKLSPLVVGNPDILLVRRYVRKQASLNRYCKPRRKNSGIEGQ